MHARRTCTVALSLLSASFLLFAALPAGAAGTADEQIVITVVGDEPGEKSIAYLGVYFETVTRRMAMKLDYPHETGIIITKVVSGSPAEEAGIKGDDIVYSFAGAVVEGESHFSTLVRRQEPGDKVAIVVFRKGREKKIDVKLGERKDVKIVVEDFGRLCEESLKSVEKALQSSKRLHLEPFLLRGRLGLTMRDLDDDLAGYFQVKKNEGVLVLDVEDGSAAEKAGIKSGDVIVSVSGNPVTEIAEVIDEISDVEPGAKASIVVVRKGAKKTFEVEIEAGSYGRQYYLAPFKESEESRKAFEKQYKAERDADSKKLKKELEALRERVRELEERLKKSEKK